MPEIFQANDIMEAHRIHTVLLLWRHKLELHPNRARKATRPHALLSAAAGVRGLCRGKDAPTWVSLDP